MGRTHAAVVACLLALTSVTSPVSARCADGLPSAALQPRLLSDELREACAADAQRLVYCSTYSSPYTLLTGQQRTACCAALQQFNTNGCFCGWGAAADISMWLQSVLVDLAGVVEECADTRVRCRREEEYFVEAAKQSAQRGLARGVNEPHNAALFTAQVSNPGLTQVKTDTRLNANPFRVVDFTQRTNGAAPRLYRPSDFPLTRGDVQQQVTGALTLPDLAMSEEPRPAPADQDSAEDQPATFMLPFLDLRLLKDLMPKRGASSSTDAYEPMGEDEVEETTESQSDSVDIEVEIEQTGGDSEELSSTLSSVGNWLGIWVKKRQGGQSGVAERMDPMDRTDSLPLLLSRVVDVLRDVLENSDAQVELALEITVETGNQPNRRGTASSTAMQLASLNRQPTSPDEMPAGMDMMDVRGEGMVTQQEGPITVEDMIEEERESMPFHVHHHCWMGALVQSAVAHPALIIGMGAVLAGIAGLALLCKEAEDKQTAAEEADAREEAGKLVAYNVIVASDKQYLAPDLTAPLLDTQGSLIHGFASKPNRF